MAEWQHPLLASPFFMSAEVRQQKTNNDDSKNHLWNIVNSATLKNKWLREHSCREETAVELRGYSISLMPVSPANFSIPILLSVYRIPF